MVPGRPWKNNKAKYQIFSSAVRILERLNTKASAHLTGRVWEVVILWHADEWKKDQVSLQNIHSVNVWNVKSDNIRPITSPEYMANIWRRMEDLWREALRDQWTIGRWQRCSCDENHCAIWSEIVVQVERENQYQNRGWIKRESKDQAKAEEASLPYLLKTFISVTVLFCRRARQLSITWFSLTQSNLWLKLKTWVLVRVLLADKLWPAAGCQ